MTSQHPRFPDDPVFREKLVRLLAKMIRAHLESEQRRASPNSVDPVETARPNPNQSPSPGMPPAYPGALSAKAGSSA